MRDHGHSVGCAQSTAAISPTGKLFVFAATRTEEVSKTRLLSVCSRSAKTCSLSLPEGGAGVSRQMYLSGMFPSIDEATIIPHFHDDLHTQLVNLSCQCHQKAPFGSGFNDKRSFVANASRQRPQMRDQQRHVSRVK